MTQSTEGKKEKGWKQYLLKSGVPLEYEIALELAKQNFAVDADFSFMRRDMTAAKECSVDVAARRYGPTDNNVRYEFNLLIECKYRSPEKFLLFLEEPNDEYSPATLGGTVNSFDMFSANTLYSTTFDNFERQFDFVYKGIELYNHGAIEEEFRHGIEQLRYVSPHFLRQNFESNLFSIPQDSLAIFFTKILVTNAPMWILNRHVNMETIKKADKIEDIARSTETAILYSDYGPDFEDHFRSIFQSWSKEHADAAKNHRDELRELGKKIRYDFVSDTAEVLKELSVTGRYITRKIGTQFFVTTASGFPRLLKSLSAGCQASYRNRIKPRPKKERKRTS